MSDIDYEALTLLMDHGIDVQSRTVYLSDNYDENGDDTITSMSVEKLFKALKVLEAIDNTPITIVLNSAGGDILSGMAMYDMIKASPLEITVKVCGAAHSMGAIILQAADKRVMAKNSTMLLHYGQTSIDAESDNFKRWQLEYERMELVMEDILFRRVRRKLSKGQLRGMMKFDTILNAEKALKFGLIDEVEE